MQTLQKMVRLGYMLFALVCACALLRGTGSEAYPEQRDLMALTAVEPPKRPEQFRNIEEINDYLAELRQYYTILGRPRFGRSVDRILGREQQKLLKQQQQELDQPHRQH